MGGEPEKRNNTPLFLSLPLFGFCYCQIIDNMQICVIPHKGHNPLFFIIKNLLLQNQQKGLVSNSRCMYSKVVFCDKLYIFFIYGYGHGYGIWLLGDYGSIWLYDISLTHIRP